MTLLTLTGALSATSLNTNFSDKLQTIVLNATSGARDWQVDMMVSNSVYTATSAYERQLDFVPADDAELRAFGLSASFTSPGDGDAIIASIKAINADEAEMTKYFLGQSLTASVGIGSYPGGTERFDYTSATGTKHFLLKGITYRLELEKDDGDGINPGGWSQAFVVLRARRRRA